MSVHSMSSCGTRDGGGTYDLNRGRVLARSQAPRVDRLALTEEVGKLLALSLPGNINNVTEIVHEIG